MILKPLFRIGDISIAGDLVLAPMDGITDSPFRLITRRLGSAMSTTGFINAQDVVNRHPFLANKIAFSPEERPIAFQLYDDNPDRLLQAAIILQRSEPDLIDINLGCPARTVAGRGAGAALMRDPQKVAIIFSHLSRAVQVPVTAKIRLGWDKNNRNYLEIARIIEENGGRCIAVHARTRDQAYSGQVDWDAIGQIKDNISIPVIGNGEVRTVKDIESLKNLTGCDAVMIGRAAIENPWIFSRRERESVSPEEVIEIMHEQLQLMCSFHGKASGIIHFRKFVKGYLHPYHVSRYEIGAILSTTEEDVLWEHVGKVIFE